MALFAGWLLLVHRWSESVEPGGPTLADVLAKMPEPAFCRVITRDQTDYLALFAPIQPFPCFPSGCPVYVFDGAGRLVDWTADMGDDEAFNARWPVRFGGRPVGMAGVLRWPGARA